MRTAYAMAAPEWFVVTVQVTNSDKQQEVLESLQRIPGLTALGTSEGDDNFVVFDCEDQTMKRSADVLIEGIDPGCIQAFAANPRKQLGSSG